MKYLASGDVQLELGERGPSTGYAVVQICKHDAMVAVHVLTEGDRIENYLGFFGLTVRDWIENRWRLEVWPVEQVRVGAFCTRHST